MTETLLTAPSAESTNVAENYTRAVNLNSRIILSAQMAQQNLIEVCKGLKEMKELGLYAELGYRSFDEYTETELGIKSRQAYKYISIAENLPDDFLHPGAKIGASKLYLLSTLSKEEREEVATKTDLEMVSKRELEQKVKEIKLLRRDLERAEQECDTLTKDCEQLKIDLNSASKKNTELSNKVSELESRPIDVAVQDNDEEMNELRRTVESMEKEKAESDKKHKAQIEELAEQYKSKLAEIEKNVTPEFAPDPKEAFKLYYTMAYNAFDSLVKFTGRQTQDHKKLFIDKIEELADRIKESAENVR